MTLDELCSVVSAKTGLSNVAASEDRLFMERWANEGVARVLMKTRIYVVSVTFNLTAGDSSYRFSEIADADVPNGVLAILSFEFRGEPNRRAIQTDYETVLQQLRSNESSGVRYYSLVGNDYLWVAPAPQSGESVEMIAVPKPTKMTAGANDPSAASFGGIPEYGHKAIEQYMVWQAMERLRDPADNAIVAARKMFESECGEIRKWTRSRAGRGFPRAKVGYPEWRNLSRRNDVYPRG